MKMYAWKFFLPVFQSVLGDDGVRYSGLMTTIIAPDAETARQTAREYAKVYPHCLTAWLDKVTPQQISLDDSAVLCWAQV